MSALRAMLAIGVRTARETWGGGAGLLLPLGFFLGSVALAPIAVPLVGEDAGAQALGLTWLLLALASLITLERLFQADLEDGTLDLDRLGPLPIEAVVVSKLVAVWLISALPILASAPLAAIMLGASPGVAMDAVWVWALGSLSFFAWGAVGASLAATVRRAGLLIALIVLPLFAPAIIFGTRATAMGPDAAASGLFLIANTLFACAIGPIAAAQALKLGDEA